MIKISIINIYLGIVTTGCTLKSKVLNLSLITDKDEENNKEKLSIYIENESIEEDNLNEESLSIYNNQTLKNNKSLFSNFNDVILCKCKDYKIPDYITYYLNKISNKDDIVIFHTMNPIDWFFFINIGFKINKELECPIFDSRIFQYPKDLLGHLCIGDLNISEIQDVFNNILIYDEKNFNSNSLIQSFVLRDKFKLINFKEE